MKEIKIDYKRLQYVTKLVISGNCFEWLEFEVSPRILVRKQKEVKHKTKEERISEYIESGQNVKNHRTTKRTIERLIRCNAHLNKFLTLTFAENLTDITEANSLFHSFIGRIIRQYPDFQYVCVPEFQKRGAVHYHLVCNLPYIKSDDLGAIWNNGFIKIKQVDQVRNLALYLTKYLTKEIFDGRLFGKKKFFCSQKLNRPQIFYDHDAINALGGIEGKEQIYERKFNSFFGRSLYRLYETFQRPEFLKINPNK